MTYRWKNNNYQYFPGPRPSGEGHLNLIRHRFIKARGSRKLFSKVNISKYFAAIACVLMLFTTNAYGLSLTVNTTIYANDFNPADAICDIHNPADGLSPECSLRAAVQTINVVQDVINSIGFDIPHTDPRCNILMNTVVCTISSGTFALTPIYVPVFLSGEGQPEWEPNTLNIGNNAKLTIEIENDTIRLDGGGSTVRGLVMKGSNILLNSSNNTVSGNFIGTDASGTVATGGQGIGLGPNTTNNLIGGELNGERNLISGTSSTKGGIEFCFLSNCDGNKIINNYIGTNAMGNAALGNAGNGIYVVTNNNEIRRNVISGNVGNGVLVFGSNNVINHNMIGTNASGTKHQEILGNTVAGIRIDSTGSATDNQIGGELGNLLVSDGNIIAFNQGAGIFIKNDTAVRNSILSNSIYQNGVIGNDYAQLGIELVNNISGGPEPNDDQDQDTGPNELQNHPVISAAILSTLNTEISGTLNSKPNENYILQFFTNSECNNNTLAGFDYGEGETLLGTITVTTDTVGNATFSNVILSGIAPPGQTIITATATDLQDGNTSEFSQCFDVTPGPGELDFDPIAYSVVEDAGTVDITVVRTGGTTGSVSVDYMSSAQTATAGADYTDVDDTLDFLDGEDSQIFTITLLDDTLIENDETVLLMLSNPTGGASLGTNIQAQLTITDDETGADLELSIHGFADIPLNTWLMEYTLTVTNLGPDIATGIEVNGGFPDTELEYDSHNTNDGSYDPAADVWLIGSLNKNETAVLIIHALKRDTFDSGVVTYTTTVSADQDDPDTSNNTATNDTGIGGHDLGITLSDNPDPVPPSSSSATERVTYTVDVRSLTPGSAENVRVSFQTFTGTVYSTDNSLGTINCVIDTATHVMCYFPAIFSGGALIDIVVTPVPGVDNTASASVSSDTFDPVTSNNNDSENTLVEAGIPINPGEVHKDERCPTYPYCCFIATAAYGSYLEPEVEILRNYRDRYLITNKPGRAIVEWYYKTSPPIAKIIAEHDSLRWLTRLALSPLVYSIKYPAWAGLSLLLIILLPLGWKLGRKIRLN